MLITTVIVIARSAACYDLVGENDCDMAWLSPLLASVVLSISSYA